MLHSFALFFFFSFFFLLLAPYMTVWTLMRKYGTANEIWYFSVRWIQFNLIGSDKCFKLTWNLIWRLLLCGFYYWRLENNKLLLLNMVELIRRNQSKRRWNNKRSERFELISGFETQNFFQENVEYSYLSFVYGLCQ